MGRASARGHMEGLPKWSALRSATAPLTNIWRCVTPAEPFVQDVPRDIHRNLSGSASGAVMQKSVNLIAKPTILAATLLAASLMAALPAWSQNADTVLVNGKILTVDNQFSTRQALAIRDMKIVAIGSSEEIKKMAGPATRVIDLQGRTVIPGLIDDHMHASRAARSFSTEVNWIGATSLAEGLDRIREAARTAAPGAWMMVVTPPATVETFKEKRRPTQAELIAAAPNNPVYVQLAYGWAMMTPLAFKALNITADSVLPGGAKLEKDANRKADWRGDRQHGCAFRPASETYV